MNLIVRKAQERGHVDMGWLDSWHSFSFGHYYDPRHMGLGPLRVINDDRVAGGGGFPTHPHDNMEIITYVLLGALEHKDSMGNGSVIRRGDVQYMAAGTGVRHSEFNHSETEGVHLLQIWVLPDTRGVAPRYGQKHFSDDEKRNKLCLIASKTGRHGSIAIHNEVDLFACVLEDRASLHHSLEPQRLAWIQIATGSAEVNGITLNEGDAVATQESGDLTIIGKGGCEALLFDLPR